MAYIVDLIIIMQMIFIISEARPDRVVKPEEVEDVLNRFEANQCNDVHQEIRQFIREMGVLKAVITYRQGCRFRKDCESDRSLSSKRRG